MVDVEFEYEATIEPLESTFKPISLGYEPAVLTEIVNVSPVHTMMVSV